MLHYFPFSLYSVDATRSVDEAYKDVASIPTGHVRGPQQRRMLKMDLYT